MPCFSIGPSISDAVNGVAGLPKEPRSPETFTAERLVRTLVRTTATGFAYYAGDALTQGLVTTIGAHFAGPLGMFVAMAGPAVVGMVAGSVIDAIAGAKLGSLGGSLYEWISGKPKAEHRPPAPPTPAVDEKSGPAAATPTPTPTAAGATAAPSPAAPGAPAVAPAPAPALMPTAASLAAVAMTPAPAPVPTASSLAAPVRKAHRHKAPSARAPRRALAH